MEIINFYNLWYKYAMRIEKNNSPVLYEVVPSGQEP